MAKNIGLIIILIFCGVILYQDRDHPANVKHWMLLGISELCAQILVTKKN